MQQLPTSDSTAVVAVRATAIALQRSHSLAQALELILHSCWAQVLANQVAANRGDVEGVHQLRVGVRRLRAALRLLRRATGVALDGHLLQELRWLNSLLGPLRDWDVFLHQSLPPVQAAFPQRNALLSIQRRVEMARAQQQQLLDEGFASERYQQLCEAWQGWLEQRVWLESEQLSPKARARLEADVPRFARTTLKRLEQRVCRLGEQFEQLDTAGRHTLRIRIKQLRYSLEFFASLYPVRRTQRYRQALALLQEELGSLNDAAVVGELLDGVHLTAQSSLRPLFEGWYGGRAALQLQQFAEQTWPAWRACPSPWVRKR